MDEPEERGDAGGNHFKSFYFDHDWSIEQQSRDDQLRITSLSDQEGHRDVPSDLGQAGGPVDG